MMNHLINEALKRKTEKRRLDLLRWLKLDLQCLSLDELRDVSCGLNVMLGPKPHGDDQTCSERRLGDLAAEDLAYVMAALQKAMADVESGTPSRNVFADLRCRYAMRGLEPRGLIRVAAAAAEIAVIELGEVDLDTAAMSTHWASGSAAVLVDLADHRKRREAGILPGMAP